MNERKLGIGLSYLNIVLHAIVGFLYVPLLLHYIGASEYGLYQLIGSLIAYFSIMDFGLTAAVVRFYSKYKAVGDAVNMQNILALSLRAYGMIAVILGAVGFICYCNLGKVFAASMTVVEIDSAKSLFLLLLFNIVLTILTMIFRAVINAHEKFLVLKGLETVQMILQPILVVLVLQKYPSALAVAMVQTVLNIGLIAARIYYCFVKLHIKVKFHHWDKALIKEFKKLAFSVFAVTLIDQIFFRTNQIILGVISGTAAVAIYSISSLIYMNYMALSVAISGVYLPHITELIAKNEPMTKLSDLFRQIGRWQFFLLALVSSGFVIFGRQFIAIWAGAGFADAYWITLLIILPFTIDLIQNIGLSIMQAQNKYDFRAKVYFCMGIFNLCLSIPLGMKYGGIGCAFATGLSMFIGNGLIMNWYYWKEIKFDIVTFWRDITSILWKIAVLTLVAYFGNDLLHSGSKIVYCGKIVVYTVVYAVIVYRFCMNEEEKYRIKNLAKYFNMRGM